MRKHLPRAAEARSMEKLRRVIAGGLAVPDLVTFEDDLTITDRIEAALQRFQAPPSRDRRKAVRA